MGMTIDTAISWLPNIAEHKGEYISIYNEDVEAIKIGVETMRKYKKIQEIMNELKGNFYGSYLKDRQTLEKIYEVIEDGECK
jgi:ABC-type phosphate transport system auxiliary subunit